MEKPLISVIVPVYNVEKYIKECLNSIIKQTYKKLQIILIDDGSTDNSGEICDSYQAKDDRINVIHKENGGLSDARNKGLEIAEGDYLAFVDSDDFIAEDYVEYLLRILEKYNADVSVCSKQNFNAGEVIKKKEEEAEVIVYTGIAAMESLLYQKNIENSAWGKLYKASLFKDIFYPVGKLYEDLGTTYKVLYKAEKVIWSSEKKYFYRQRYDSIMKKKFTMSNIDRIEVSQDLLRFVEDKCKSLHKAAVSRFFISNIQVLREVPLKENQYSDVIYEIKRNIKQFRKEVLLDKKAKKINRLIALASYGPIGILQKLGKLHKKVYK